MCLDIMVTSSDRIKEMVVHSNQTRHRSVITEIQSSRGCGHGYFRCWTNSDDASGIDKNGLIFACRISGSVNDANVR